MATGQLNSLVRHIHRIALGRDSVGMTDGELLKRFVAHQDKGAFEALVRRYGPLVLGVCRRVLHHRQDAEDAFQATFLVLLHKAGSIAQPELVGNWLYGVAHYTAKNAKASAARRRARERGMTEMPRAQLVADEDGLQELRPLLDEEISRLPEKYRVPVVLCELQGKSRKEVARHVGCPEGTISSRLARARQLLRQRLLKRGLTLSAGSLAVALSQDVVLASVPAPLVSSTIKTAALIAASPEATAGVVSAQVAALTEGVLKTMFLAKLKTATAVLLAVSILTGAAMLTHQAVAAKQSDAASGAAQKAPGDENAKADPGKASRKPQLSAPKREAEEAVRVRGRVLDPDGKPVAGAKLYLGGYTSPKERKYPVRATSGDDGRFAFTFARAELEQLDADDLVYQVLAVAKGHGCAWVTADATVGDALTLRLVKDVPVSGRILDADGKPVAGAKLTVTGVCAAKGGDDGGFVHSVTMGTDYLKYAYGRGWVGPLPGQPAVLTTGADGSFKVSVVGRDRVVSLRVEGRGIATAGVGAHGDKFEYHAAVSRPIRGVVRDKDTGKGLAGVTVFLSGGINPRYQESGSPRAVTDKEGRYELLGLAKSPRYTLAVRPANGQTYFQRTVPLEDNPGLEPQTADIDLVQGITVHGKVTDKATGKPVAGTLVEYYPLYANPNVDKLPGVWHPRSEATTGPDGSYTLTVLPAQGVIGIVAPNRDTYMPAVLMAKECKDFFKTPVFISVDVDVVGWAIGSGRRSLIGHIAGHCHALVFLEPGEKEQGLVKDVVLERAQERKGRVIGPDGKPLTGVAVFGLGRNGVVNGAEFTVRGINPKATRHLLFFHKEKNLGFYLKELPGEKDGPLTVKLQPCGAAFGRMVDRDGKPVAGMRLNFAAVVWAGTVGAPPQSVTTDKEGRFRVEGLVPGYGYPVTGLAPGVKSEQAPDIWEVLVREGEQKDLGDVQAERKR